MNIALMCVHASIALLAVTACTHPVSNASPGDVTRDPEDTASPSTAGADDGTLRPGRVTIGEPGVFSIPLESGVFPIVHCELDGAASRFALLDTGAASCLISPSQADRMRCERRKMNPLDGASPTAGLRLDTYLRVPEVLLGLMKIKDSSMPVAELPLRIDCLLGSDVLSQTSMLMEAKSRRATFGSESRIEDAVRKKYPGQTLTEVKLVPAQLLFTLVVETGFGNLKLLLDTGANSTSLNRSTMKSRNVEPKYTHRASSEDLASAATHDFEFFGIRDMKLGAWTIDVDAIGESGPLYDEFQFDGILGFDVLGQIPWIFDPGAARIVVVSPKEGEARHLSSGVRGVDGDDFDLRRMCADSYEPIVLSALETIAVANEPKYLDLAGPLLADKRGGIGMAAAYAIMKTIGADWPPEEMYHSAIQWWDDRPPAGK